MKKRNFLFLLFCFLFLVFAACSNNSVNSGPDNGTAGSGENQDSEAGKENNEDQEDEKDYYQTPEMDFYGGGNNQVGFLV